MAFGFTATRPMRLAATLLVVCWVSGARAEEASPPASQQQPAATPSPSPSGQKGGAGRGTCRDAAACGRTTSPAAGFHHQADAGAARPHARLHRHRRLDPPVRRQGRAAGRHRLHLLSARRHRSRNPAGDVPVQWRPGRVLGLAAIRRRRPVAPVDIGRGRGIFGDAGSAAQRRDLARLHRSRLHRSRRHRLQPFRRVRRGRAQAVLSRSTATSARSRW